MGLKDSCAMAPSADKVINAEEYLKHAKEDDLWLLIDGKVYDVTKYQEEHPGSDSILHDVMGKDATQEFDDVGHSKDAIAVRDKLLVGDFDMEQISQVPGYDANAGSGGGGDGGALMYAIPLIILVVILAVVFKVIPMN